MEKKFPPVIELNVGGKHYTTTLLTLVKCKDTMLAAMFSGNYDVKMDQHGRYFIDADGENFHYILNYLRYGELPPQEISPKIYREAVYFGLQGMVEELEKHPIFLAKIHRESFRAQFPGYTKLVNSIINKVHQESVQKQGDCFINAAHSIRKGQKTQTGDI
nr:BTB/POZ domain-containing protein KCTD7 [Crassostrea gigas]